MSGRVVVVGSTNLDLVVTAPAIPAPGETVLGQEYTESAGGKGLNQAIGAARESPTSLVAAVGADAAADVLEAAAREHDVDPAFVRLQEQPSGRALITVDAYAENAITVAPGANASLEPAHVRAELARLAPDVVLAQCEVRAEVVAATADWCEQHGARFVLNASPVREQEVSVLRLADPLVVNEGEATAMLTYVDGTGSPVSVEDAARRLAGLARSVVVTRGSSGALVGDRGEATRSVPAAETTGVVDTTGAGDEYVGALAAALASGVSLADAAARAGAAAAALIGKPRAER